MFSIVFFKFKRYLFILLSTVLIINQFFVTSSVEKFQGVSYSTNESFSRENFTFILSNSFSTTQNSAIDLNSTLVLRDEDDIDDCLFNNLCDHLPATCVVCDFNSACVYGQETEITCRVKDNVLCLGPRTFNKKFNCMYCYQTSLEHHNCTFSTACKVNVYPKQRYQANCTVDKNIFCLGKRKFPKMRICNWTSGRRWRTAFILSITLGGLGIDRFYLGLWKEGLGKLFSFGGVGVWTLIDILLIGAGYLTPADGSLYI